MRSILLTLLLILHASFLASQCMPAFRAMPKQPPAAPKGYWNDPNWIGGGSDLVMTAASLSDTMGIHDTLIIRRWDDTGWVAYPKLFIREYASFQLYRWSNRIFITGHFKTYNSVTAPSGYSYTALECKNGAWDSVPNSLVLDSIYYQFASNKNGFYRMTTKLRKNSFNQYYHYIGEVQVFNSSSGTFNKVLSYVSYAGAGISGGRNRLLISGTDTVDGQHTNGFGYVDSVTVNQNTDTRFDSNRDYYIDPTDDHIYLIPYSGSPVIKEFSSSYVGTRTTSSFPHTSTGGAGVYDGKIVYVSYDDDNNQYVNVLCRNQTQWKTIVHRGGWYNQVSVNTGFYYYNANTRIMMVLDQGSLIDGYAFIDLDSNCVKGSSDSVVRNQLVTAKDSLYWISALTDSSGYYQLFVVPGTYELSGPSVKTSCGPDSVVVTANNTTTQKNLPMLRPGFHDLKARLLNGYRVRWNDHVGYRILLENLGEPSDSAYVEFNADGKLALVSANAGLSLNGNKASGVIRNLSFFDKRYINVVAWVDTASTKPDSIVCSDLLAYLYDSEKDSSNNLDTICQLVVYSLDPNYKSCNHEIVPPLVSTKLDYTIEFQNEGNDDAHDVVITDQLSANLDVSTFKVIGASHPYTLSMNGDVLTVTFKNIFLKPKKTNEQQSKGFFKYSISTKTGLANKSTIRNTAYIYFDLNKPVITNTNIVTVSLWPLSVETPVAPNLSVYPNPMNEELHIFSSGNENIYIYSLDGKVIRVLTAAEGVQTISTAEWPSGIYIVRYGNLYMKVVKGGN